MKLMRISPFSGQPYIMDLPITEPEFSEALARYEDGAYIQDAFHMLDADQREFILTGIPPVEWAETFGEDE